MLNHVLTNWKTSAAGVLLAVITVAGVLSQQGITLGAAGTGTVVALIGALASALLGLIARDPEPARAPNGSTQKLGAIMLVALLLPLPVLQGCTTSSSALRADGNVLVVALNNLAAAVQVQDPATASKLTEAAQALQAAVNSTVTGTTWQQALNASSAAVEVILASIPSTSAYAPLVAIAVAATEAIIANSTPVATSARYFTAEQRTNLLVYRTRGQDLVKHRPLRSVRGDYVAAWNAAAKHADLPAAAIR